MAGLAAAYELHERGHKVTVLEGSKRVGGRVLTHRFKDGSHVELGAMRVPLSHDYTRHYIKEVGLEKTLIDFFNTTDQNFLDIRDVVCRRADGAQRIYPLWGIPGANSDPGALSAVSRQRDPGLVAHRVDRHDDRRREAHRSVRAALARRACAISTTSRSAISWPAALRPRSAS